MIFPKFAACYIVAISTTVQEWFFISFYKKEIITNYRCNDDAIENKCWDQKNYNLQWEEYLK
jgi:hypothetical protein